MDLTELRNQIDKIDEQLVSLLLERMEISKAVAEYKAEHSLPVLNTEREEQILRRVAEKCGEQSDAVTAVYTAVLNASKELQQRIIDNR